MTEWNMEMEWLREMEPWQREVAEVLACADVEDLLGGLAGHLGELNPLGDERQEDLNLVFANLIAGCEGDIMAAFWVAFWLGAAWQRGSDAPRGDETNG